MNPSIDSHPLITSIKGVLTDLNISPPSGILVGVSGGPDSMVLLTALKELGYLPTAAHVNFQLRGRESDLDAHLVREWCSTLNVPFTELVSDTAYYAEVHRLNIQSAAREIRYNWWLDLVEKGDFDTVATAHHLDDRVETFFLNLLRGTGIKGLRSIPVQRDCFIRPMMNVSRSEIESFAALHNIPFRTDSSNKSGEYQRNRIRHHLIPLLHDLRPGFDAVMQHNLARFELEWTAWDQAYQNWQKQNVHDQNHKYALKTPKAEYPFLLRWLEEKGFPWSLVHDYISAQQPDGGKVLEYNDHRLSRTAEGFYLEKTEVPPSIVISGPGTYQIDEIEISIERVSLDEFTIDADPCTEFADLRNITWPLALRPIEAGDNFQPLGMKGKSKKLQDYLVDLRLDYFEKSKVRILTSADHIIWVVGMRLDERAKITGDTQDVYRLRCKNL